MNSGEGREYEHIIKEHAINTVNYRVMSGEGRKGGKKGRERKLPWGAAAGFSDF